MTEQEYKSILKNLESDFYQEKCSIAKRYAFSNNEVKTGDVVTDHIGSVLVESIHFGWGMGRMPISIYYGLSLRKDGVPRKDGEKREVWQSNLIIK